MRFVCDHDVDARVAAALRKTGHQAWTIEEAGLSRAGDDDLTVYAMDRGAVLLTHDYRRCANWATRMLKETVPMLVTGYPGAPLSRTRGIPCRSCDPAGRR
ncbi:MAG: DUF5615 family PIN-like protein [Sciscionella sp.]